MHLKQGGKAKDVNGLGADILLKFTPRRVLDKHEKQRETQEQPSGAAWNQVAAKAATPLPLPAYVRACLGSDSDTLTKPRRAERPLGPQYPRGGRKRTDRPNRTAAAYWFPSFCLLDECSDRQFFGFCPKCRELPADKHWPEWCPAETQKRKSPPSGASRMESGRKMAQDSTEITRRIAEMFPDVANGDNLRPPVNVMDRGVRAQLTPQVRLFSQLPPGTQIRLVASVAKSFTDHPPRKGVPLTKLAIFCHLCSHAIYSVIEGKGKTSHENPAPLSRSELQSQDAEGLAAFGRASAALCPALGSGLELKPEEPCGWDRATLDQKTSFLEAPSPAVGFRFASSISLGERPALGSGLELKPEETCGWDKATLDQ
eukprot:g11369.t1